MKLPDPTHFLCHWQRAAGFAVWPWGDRFDSSLCNSEFDDTTPVDQYPGGVSCQGILDRITAFRMRNNVNMAAADTTVVLVTV